MPAIQVRDFSQETYDLIKQEAKRNGRSIMQQTKHIVLEHFADRSQKGYAAGLANSIPDSVRADGLGASALAGDEGILLPSAGANPFSVETTESIDRRQRRREALFARIASRNYPASALRLDSAQIIREIRDER